MKVSIFAAAAALFGLVPVLAQEPSARLPAGDIRPRPGYCESEPSAYVKVILEVPNLACVELYPNRRFCGPGKFEEDGIRLSCEIGRLRPKVLKYDQADNWSDPANKPCKSYSCELGGMPSNKEEITWRVFDTNTVGGGDFGEAYRATMYSTCDVV